MHLCTPTDVGVQPRCTVLREKSSITTLLHAQWHNAEFQTRTTPLTVVPCSSSRQRHAMLVIPSLLSHACQRSLLSHAFHLLTVVTCMSIPHCCHMLIIPLPADMSCCHAVKARQSAAAAKALTDSPPSLQATLSHQPNHKKAAAASSASLQAPLPHQPNKQPVAAASSAAPSPCSSRGVASDAPEQLSQSQKSTSSPEIVLGLAILPVDLATMQLLEQQAAARQEVFADAGALPGKGVPAPLFFMPLTALASACVRNCAQRQRNQQLQSPQQILTAPSLHQRSAEASASAPVEYTSDMCSLSASVCLTAAEVQRCNAAVAGLLTSATTVCFSSQGMLRGWFVSWLCEIEIVRSDDYEIV